MAALPLPPLVKVVLVLAPLPPLVTVVLVPLPLLVVMPTLPLVVAVLLLFMRMRVRAMVMRTALVRVTAAVSALTMAPRLLLPGLESVEIKPLFSPFRA
jgi:hypothetical protein